MTSTEAANERAMPIEPRIDDTMTHYAVTIVPTQPSSYPRQVGLTCGEYNARAIVDAFGLSFAPDMHPRLRVRLFGLSFLTDLAGTLVRHGLDAEIRNAADLHDESRLALLRGHIDSHEPIILAIGNGHLSRDRNWAFFRTLVGHFITIYGYDAERDVFFVYDPYLGAEPTGLLPIGNAERTADEILRDWRGPFYYRWIGMNHAYITVTRPR